MTENEVEIDYRRPLEKNTILYKKYLVESLIGKGGFGLVYLANDVDSNEKVAIKEYFPCGKSTREIDSDNLVFYKCSEKEIDFEKLDIIKNEADVLQKVSNIKGVISYKDSFYENNTFYIIMEHIKGITLQMYVQSHGIIKYSEMMELLTPIANVLYSMHKMSIVHRDICPENILVSDTLEVKLIDFGSALDLKKRNSEMLLEPTYRKGYSIPQKCKKESEFVFLSDAYLMLATCYYCMTGKTIDEI